MMGYFFKNQKNLQSLIYEGFTKQRYYSIKQ